MVSVVTPTQFVNLKREAKRRRRASNELSHSAILDQIALESGYANWSLLAKAVNSQSSVQSLKVGQSIDRNFEVRLSGWVWARGLERRIEQFWHLKLPTKYPASHYSKCRRIPENWDVIRSSLENTISGIESVQRVLAFMDATDLRPSAAFSSLFPSNTTPVGLDHVCVWRDSSNRYVVTNEPYILSEKVSVTKAWCEANGWTYHQMPRHIGMHNPCSVECSKECGEHTVLILMSPPKRGDDLATITEPLLKNFHLLNSTKISGPTQI